MLLVIQVTLLGMLFHHVECNGQFYGGSMSYVMEEMQNGDQLVTIELITGWVLGKGPCGPACSKSNIGNSTRPTRPAIISSDPYYLGKFVKEYRLKNNSILTIPIDTRVRSTYKEKVIAISETGKWEQEMMHFTVIMEKEKKEMDIVFTGYSWRKLPLQTSQNNPEWHFQTKVVSHIRNDTNTTNQSPKSIAKPFYRIKLDKVSEIRLPAVDGDDDFIKCEISKGIEGGVIAGHPPPYVTVMENCSVYINASQTHGYKDDTWIVVPVSVRDYNRKNIRYGIGYGIFYVGKYSLSTTTVQFAVQILANLTTPVFVDPTYEGNHVFIMYSGTEWKSKIYAEASENTTIDEFTTFGIQGEPFTISKTHRDSRRPQVKYSIMSWKPSPADVGRHIACVSVTDSTGVESDEERCFVIDVHPDEFHYSSTFSENIPYFIDIPSPDQLIDCKIHATCVVAIYVKSKVEVSEIRVTNSAIERYNISPIQSVTHKGEQVYKTELSFEHNIRGKINICFQAKDINGVKSEVVCIISFIESPDPCISGPCKNLAICERDLTTGGFRCLCRPKTYGKTCNQRIDFCKPDPCTKNNSYTCFAETCWCKPGFTGTHCETKETPAQATTPHSSLINGGVPLFSSEIEQGQIDSVELDGVSGLAASRLHPDILYSHNDHGDRPRLFAINASTAEVVAILDISPAYHNDWEDIAVGPCAKGDQRTCIYILDDGNYHGVDKKTIYRVVEPNTIVSQTIAPDSIYTYNWTEPAAETIMVDNNADMYVISNVLGGRGMIAKLPAQAWGQNNPVNINSGSYFSMSSSHHDPEGGDISADGTEVLVKTKDYIYYWKPSDGDIVSALTYPGVKLPYHKEWLGRAVCWSADGSAYYTLGEGPHQTLFKYKRA